MTAPTTHRAARTWLCAALAVVALLGAWGLAQQARADALPDHRAYEMVSPPDKNGGDVVVVPGRQPTVRQSSTARWRASAR